MDKIHTMSDWHKYKLVSKEKWIELFNQNKEVYKIYKDDSETLIENINDFNIKNINEIVWFWIEIKE